MSRNKAAARNEANAIAPVRSVARVLRRREEPRGRNPGAPSFLVFADRAGKPPERVRSTVRQAPKES